MGNRIGQKFNNIKCALSLQYYDVQKLLNLKAHYRFEISRTDETWKTLEIVLEKWITKVCTQSRTPIDLC